MLFTIEKYHHKLAATTKTWGPKCDGIIYASDKTDRVLGTVNVPHEGKEEYNSKSVRVVQYLLLIAVLVYLFQRDLIFL